MSGRRRQTQVQKCSNAGPQKYCDVAGYCRVLQGIAGYFSVGGAVDDRTGIFVIRD